ncbi:MAG TPA: hypothetical protein DCR43_07515 [Bacteroidales bacterium]|nr:MAG: hypothetical protein A2X11_00700 [Bacteroidetes bacterium GWE2_42_24]OFY27514.1 MAG: hypothetical protein A2X09_07525 [Bacteroidetes bacterium GWF2_43_11]HAQ65682.1 hypothetical protein [Bacteroidales bacterium]HBZ66036.1 hypothetical protein [Bacteroidales bacterium]
MKAIVLKRKLTTGETTQLLALLRDNDNFRLHTSIIADERLMALSTPSPVNQFSIKKKVNEQVLQELLAMGDKLVKGKRVADLLSFEKSGVWYYHRFRSYFKTRQIGYEYEEIMQLLTVYDHIDFYTGEVGLRQIPELSGRVAICLPEAVPGSKVNYRSVAAYGLHFLLRLMVQPFQFAHPSKRRHIVVDHAGLQKCLHLPAGRFTYDNYILSGLFDRLDADFLLLSEVVMPKFDSLKTFRLRWQYYFRAGRNRNIIFNEVILFRALLSSEIRMKVKQASAHLMAGYSAVEALPLTIYERLILKQYIGYHKTSRFYVFRYLAFDRFFKHYSFFSISSIDENGPIIKTLLDAAKANRMTTIGIQHGNFGNGHPAYLYTPADKLAGSMADHTLVWGEYWRDFLATVGNFNPESVAVTGQIRTDVIPWLKKADRRNALGYDWGTRKIIVFASQPQPDASLRYQAALDVFVAGRSIKDSLVVVKLHPAERDDVQYYESIAREAGCTNYQILYNIDLYLLLSACDLLVTCFSTVGTEAVYFGKPLIILDYMKEDLLHYCSEGVAFQSTDVTSLGEIISGVLAGDLKIDMEAYARFIRKYAWVIDGKAAERSIDYIKSLY